MLLQLDTFKANGNGFGMDGALHRSSLGSQQSHHHVELSVNNIGDDGAEYTHRNYCPSTDISKLSI